MITSLRLVNFKNFADETLKVGPFTVIVGANASGKSNIRDAFRFLHGIGRGYTLAEILGGKYGPGGQKEWAGIRGAPNEVIRMGPASPSVPFWFSLGVELHSARTKTSYSIKVAFAPDSPDGFRLMDEELRADSDLVYKTVESQDPLLRLTANDDSKSWVELSRSQPALTQLATTYSWRNLNARREFSSVLGKMRYLELMPERMREPSFPGTTILGDSGENLPSVIEAICSDSGREKTLMSWLQELTPMDVKDFDFPRDPSGRVHLDIVEYNGRKMTAYSASDGTLRFLGILAALLSPSEGGLYFFEEIDNGIHPNRLWLLLDFIEHHTAKGGIQVITTTHSPALLSWLSDEAFENTSVVYRDQYWADSVIRQIAGLYNLRELRKSDTLGELHTEGWLEEAMKASEGDHDSDHWGDDEHRRHSGGFS